MILYLPFSGVGNKREEAEGNEEDSRHHFCRHVHGLIIFDSKLGVFYGMSAQHDLYGVSYNIKVSCGFKYFDWLQFHR